MYLFMFVMGIGVGVVVDEVIHHAFNHPDHEDQGHE